MDSFLLALRVIVALGVVIAAIWFVRRRNSPAGTGRKAAKPVSVIARQNLAPKVSVAVVDFGGKRFLLGVSEHGVTVLHNDVIEPEKEVALEVAPAVRDSSAEFATTLTRASKAAQVAAEPASARVSAPVRIPRDPAIDAAFASSSKLAGSVLSAATWKQAWTAIRGQR